ncbi:MAG: hypothetical protein WA766_02735, partial [Candidatus Acidiferrales bacterium]
MATAPMSPVMLNAPLQIGAMNPNQNVLLPPSTTTPGTVGTPAPLTSAANNSGGNGLSVPPSGGAPAPSTNTDPNTFLNPNGGVGAVHNYGHGLYGEPSTDPGLTSNYEQWLNSQIGQGAAPFDLSTQLATGGTTAPGQLNAPLNPILQQLMQYFQTGQSSIPGSAQLTQLAQTGDPINQLPAWQQMVAAQQQQIQQGGANVTAQFNALGNLGGSPYGNALGQYYNQAELGENAQLGQMTATAQENAANRMMSTDQFLQSGASTLGNQLQTLNQSDINNMLQEFIRTSPDYNPLLNSEYGQANS